MNRFFHWSEDNQRANNITTIIAIVLGVAGCLALLTTLILEAFDGTKSMRYNLYFVLLFVLVLVPTGYFIYHMTLKKEFKYEHLYLVIALCWGMVFQLAMPALSGPDEANHFFSAYNTSNVFLGTSSDNVEDNTSFLMRECDTQFWLYDVNFPDSYWLTADADMFGVSDDEAALMEVNMIAGAWFRYIPSGLAIMLARKLGAGLVALMYFGRITNTLFYVLCGYFAIKVTPVGKAQVCMGAMIPHVIELCSSYSYDVMSISLCILSVALCLYYSEPDIDFKAIDFLILGIVFVLIAPNKGCYMAYMLMMFCIPFKKWGKMIARKNPVNIGILVAMVAGFIVVYKRYLFDLVQGYVWKVFTLSGNSIEQYEGRPAYNFEYITNHPGQIIRLIGHTFKEYWWLDFQALLGRDPMHHSITLLVPLWIFVLMTIVFIATLVFNRGESLDKRRYIIWLVTTFATMVIIVYGCLIRFTPIDGERVQIASRYYIPIFMAGIMVTGTRAKESQWMLKLLYLQNLLLIPYIISVLVFLLNLTK
ncbi:MAG: DUF2142 domain-containing protein [Pseudobutyrivibrio sp.]|nr:DUF2142 domain-containing protein [Pseudobutyrivibrio sp.]